MPHASPSNQLYPSRKRRSNNRNRNSQLDAHFQQLRADIRGIKSRQQKIRLLLIGLVAVFAVLWFWGTLLNSLFPAPKVVPEIIAVGRTTQADLSANSSRDLVLFIHGLGGSVRTTFLHENKTNWWDILSEDTDFQDYDFAALDYGSGAFRENFSLNETVLTLKNFLDVKCSNRQHVVIIAHSLGGIVTRMTLPRTALGSGTDKNRRMTFISMGTPYDGSSLADAARHFGGFSSRTLRVLESGNMLGQLAREDWREFKNQVGTRLTHCAGYEKKKTNGALVVRQRSATLDVSPELTYGFDLDHFGLVAPENRWAENNMIVRSWILGQQSKPLTKKLLKNATLQPGFQYVLPAGQHTISQDFEVPPGVSLILEPGAKLKVRGVLTIQGKLIAKGQPQNPAMIEFDGGQTEGCLYFSGPFTRGSRLSHCVIRNGGGISISKPDPRYYREIDFTSGSDWHTIAKRDTTISRRGGACFLMNAHSIIFEYVRFENCEASEGGAVYSLGSGRTKYCHCTFESNRSLKGGGAIFLQQSEGEFASCKFVGNTTGRRPWKVSGEQWACGGGIYLGENSKVNLRNSSFISNSSAYVGGALYSICSDGERPTHGMISNCNFVANTSEGGLGAAIYADDASHINVTGCSFSGNASTGQNTRTRSGQSILDSTAKFSYFGAAVVLNGTNRFFHLISYLSADDPNSDSARSAAQTQQFGFAQKKPIILDYRFYDSPIAPDCFQAVDKNNPREIDCVVIHHVSAINWDRDSGLQAIEIKPETMPGPISADEPKYDWRRCKKIFETYKVSSHYLITRTGEIVRFVNDNDIAYHAGRSRMPAGDDREGVNEFSIGIELISSHPDDDPKVTSRADAYTAEQYDAAHLLIQYLISKYEIPLENIVGHDRIALPAGRKKDPGPFFEWQRLLSRLEESMNPTGKTKLCQ